MIMAAAAIHVARRCICLMMRLEIVRLSWASWRRSMASWKLALSAELPHYCCTGFNRGYALLSANVWRPRPEGRVDDGCGVGLQWPRCRW